MSNIKKAVVRASIAAASLGTAALGADIYVDGSVTTSGNGQTWQTAYKYLSEALDDAAGLSEATTIWVAQDTYFPDQDPSNPSGTGSRDASFEIPTDEDLVVLMYGGFEGGEDEVEDADPEGNPTILSGDIGTASQSSDNSYHVVHGEDTDELTSIDGFTITSGNANHASSTGSIGGAILIEGVVSGIVLNLERCTIEDSTATSGGGGIACEAGGITARRCTVRDNTVTGAYAGAAQGGGGIIVIDDSDLVSCDLVGNETTGDTRNGGALFADFDLRMVNCRVVANTADGEGGGVYCVRVAALTNCVLNGNVAEEGDGGGLYAVAAEISNCTVVHNTADYDPTPTGTNQDGSIGGGIYSNNVGGGDIIDNSILYFNTSADDRPLDVTGHYAQTNIDQGVIFNSDIQGYDDNCSPAECDPDNIDDDPEFNDPEGEDNTTGTLDDDLHLTDASPCLDAGDDALVPDDVLDVDDDGDDTETLPWDLDELARVIDTVDMGALEWRTCCADLDGNGFVDGADLGLLLAAWGSCPGCPEDLDGDDDVDGADLGLLLAAWGVCDDDACTGGGESAQGGGSGGSSWSEDTSAGAGAPFEAIAVDFGFPDLDALVEWLLLNFTPDEAGAILEELFGL